MKQEYSFMRPHSEVLFEIAKDAIPSTSQIVLAQYSTTSKSLELDCYRGNKEWSNFKEPKLKSSDVLTEFRKQKHRSQWLFHGSEPLAFSVVDNLAIGFQKEKVDSKAPGLFGDFFGNIYCMRIAGNDPSGLCDFLLFYFSRNDLEFCFSTTDEKDKNLDDSYKKLIDWMLGGILYQVKLKYSDDTSLQKGFTQFWDKEQAYRDRQEQEKDSRSKLQIITFASETLDRINEESSRYFTFSEACNTEIENYFGNIYALADKIKEATKYLGIRYPYEKHIRIESMHLQLNFDLTTFEEKAKEPKLELEHHNAFILLQNLEEAVEETRQQGKPILSKHVGKNIKPKEIKEAAITSRLKTHKEGIVSLMTKNPQKWPLLRNYFKPIQNLLIPSTANLANAI